MTKKIKIVVANPSWLAIVFTKQGDNRRAQPTKINK
jgi:hypothetical protein